MRCQDDCWQGRRTCRCAQEEKEWMDRSHAIADGIIAAMLVALIVCAVLGMAEKFL
jgi:hypothetical protein